MYKILNLVVEENSLSKPNHVGFRYDGAAAMIGRKNSLSVHVQTVSSDHSYSLLCTLVSVALLKFGDLPRKYLKLGNSFTTAMEVLCNFSKEDCKTPGISEFEGKN